MIHDLSDDALSQFPSEYEVERPPVFFNRAEVLAQSTIRESEDQVGMLRAHLCELGELSAQLTEKYSRLDARLAALTVLADEVTRKAKAVEAQNDAIEDAMAMLRARKTKRLIRHGRSAGLGLLAVAGVIATGSFASRAEIRQTPVMPQAAPAASEALSVPGLAPTRWVPTLSTSVAGAGGQTRLSAIAVKPPRRAAAKTATTGLSARATAGRRPPNSAVRPFASVGTLVIVSDPPGAAVLINRRPVGETPLQLQGVRSGSHAVWVEEQGYQRWTAGVLVPANKLTRVSAKLQRTSGESRVGAAAPCRMSLLTRTSFERNGCPVDMS